MLIKLFLTEITASGLWETMKAFIRGEIISYKAHQRKSRREKLAKLSQRIALLDYLYAVSKLQDTYKEPITLQAEYDLVMSHYTKKGGPDIKCVVIPTPFT